MKVIEISPRLCSNLSTEADEATRRRKHRNLHADFQDPCQRLLNAICEDSYIRPHRHRADPKSETIIAIKGSFAAVTFEDDGEILDVIRFGTEHFGGSATMNVGIEVPPGIWHTILSLQPNGIMLELKAGPFDPDAAKELAQWAPAEQTLEGHRYLNHLRNVVEQMG